MPRRWRGDPSRLGRRQADRMSDPELQSVTPVEISPGHPLAKALLALNNAHARELSWLESRSGWSISSRKRFWHGESGTSTPFCWRSIRMLATTARISCGSVPAIRALSMWTGSPSQHRREGAAARAGFITICSNIRAGPDTRALSAKSIQPRRTRSRTPSMRLWNLSRSAPRASMTAIKR